MEILPFSLISLVVFFIGNIIFLARTVRPDIQNNYYTVVFISMIIVGFVLGIKFVPIMFGVFFLSAFVSAPFIRR